MDGDSKFCDHDTGTVAKPICFSLASGLPVDDKAALNAVPSTPGASLFGTAATQAETSPAMPTGVFATVFKLLIDLPCVNSLVYPENPCHEEVSGTGILPSGSGSNWAKLEDHILGLIYGQCMGDAVGLATEFLSKEEAKSAYASTLGSHNYRHTDRVKNFHNSRWPIAAFTDDSDQMLLILDALLAQPRTGDSRVFLMNLEQWISKGFPGIKRPMGIGATVYSVISEFRTGDANPAKRVWLQSGGCLAANGAVMRTSVVGVPHFDDAEMTAILAAKFAKTTHYDPRCVASCVAVSTLVASLLRFAAAGETPDSECCLQAALSSAREKAIESIAKEHRLLQKENAVPAPKPDSEWTVYERDVATAELNAALEARDITVLNLDSKYKIGYTYSCLAAGVASLMSGKAFVDAICDLTMEAGDADTNCAVAGALLGCAFGYRKLMEQVTPFGWEKLDCFAELVQPRLQALLELVQKRVMATLM